VMTLANVYGRTQDPHKRNMCKTVMRFVEEYHVDGDCPLVRYLVAEDWNQVSAFFRGVVDGENVGRFIGKKDEEFFGYARNVMRLNNLIAVPQRVHARRAQPADDYVQHVRPVWIPTKMVMPVVVGVLALMCLLYVGVNMVGTGQRSEKKAEEFVHRGKYDKILEDHALMIENLRGEVNTYKEHVASQTHAQKLVNDARDRQVEQTKNDLLNESTRLVKETKTKVDLHLAGTESRLNDLGVKYGTNASYRRPREQGGLRQRQSD